MFQIWSNGFDDLLLKTNIKPFFRKFWANIKIGSDIFLVDEYQDTNHSQYLIVRALSDKFKIYVLLETMRKVFTPFEVPILITY
jgi:DNA helicase-2/ATP-dependent DNA helicase PcrA